MDFFQSLGNFFQGKGWRDNRAIAQDDEKKRRQQQVQVQSRTPAPQVKQAPSIAMPSSNNMASVFDITQKEPATLAQPQQPKISALEQARREDAQRQRIVAQKPKKPSFIEEVGAGLQQGAAGVADVALQAGTVINSLNPFQSEQQRTAQILATDAARRQLLSQNKDITGRSFVGTTDVEENARRIAQGRGTGEDISRVLGKGFDVANTATSVIPAGKGFQLARDLITPRNLVTASKPLVKEAAVLGSTATGADIASGRGVSPESLAINYGLPVGFGVGGAAAGAGIRASRNAIQRGINRGSDAELGSQAIQKNRSKIAPGISPSSSFERRAEEALQEADELAQVRQRVQQEQQLRQAETARLLEEQRIRQEVAAQTQPEVPQVRQPEQSIVETQPIPQIESAPIISQIDNQPELVNQTAPLELNPEQRAFQDTVEAVNQRQVEQPLPEVQQVDTTSPVQAIETPTETASREIAQQAVPVVPEELGSITRQAVLDGSINTPEGIESAITRTELTADAAAKASGDTLDNIIRKGQRVWEESNRQGRDLNTLEAEQFIEGFTPQQQAVYQNYAQEIGTLRDRGGFSLEGGYQGQWYGPRQSLTPEGTSAEFNPQMVNEIRRNLNQAGEGISNADLDVSSVPFSQALRRYANAPDQASQILVDTVENTADGLPTGLRVADQTKQNLEDAMSDVTVKRDEALRLEDAGDKKSADMLRSEVSKDIDKAFKSFIDDIPGSGKERRAAVNDVKALRDTYKQSLTATLTLSNLVNRAADQGAKAVLALQKPLVGALDKLMSDRFAKNAARVGGAVNKLNTSKEAKKAAREFSRGTQWREIRDNFNATMELAGAGQENPIARGLAKIDAFVTGSGSALTQAGDISTPIMERVFQIGLSRPEAAGLKTVEEMSQYLAKYSNTNAFKRDLDIVTNDLLPRIGLAGGKAAEEGGGKISSALSKYVDNSVRTFAESKGIKDSKIINNLNDYVKGNLTGYAGVGSRVLGTVKDAALLSKYREAAKLAESGDPAAVAQATKMASQSIADAIGFYGTGAAAALALSLGNDVVGFTGAPAESGSPEAAFNKANNIPANQWYVALGDNRIYFDPSRPFGGPGVAANLVGGAVEGDIPSAATNTSYQIYNQAGGSNIPENIVNLTTGYANPYASQNDREYAQNQTAAMFAPATGILNNAANVFDSSKRAPTGFFENLKSNLPGLRSEVPEAKDSRGNVIPNSRQISGGSGLLSVGKNIKSPQVQSDDPIGAEISRLGPEVYPTSQNTNAANPNVERLTKSLITSDFYTNADDTRKAEILEAALTGTKFKNINPDLDEASQAALASYALMSGNENSGERGKWLDNNTNARDYYVAAYENEIKNDTLTADDDNLERTSSKHYKAVASQVNLALNATPELLNAYNDISKKEFYAMSDSNPLKQKLWQLDQERSKAGVSRNSSDKSTPKYGTSSGSGGSGGGGGRSAFGGSFGELSDIASGSTKGSGAGLKYEGVDNNPFKNKEVPTIAKADAPKKKTISVKRGIQI